MFLDSESQFDNNNAFKNNDDEISQSVKNPAFSGMRQRADTENFRNDMSMMDQVLKSLEEDNFQTQSNNPNNLSYIDKMDTRRALN